MTSRPTIVHLIGVPAVGKYTIARALAELAGLGGDRYVVIDNHHTSNVIFAALDVDGVRQLPSGVWDRVGEVREAVLRTIEELSPCDWSFVFTNVLTDQDAADTLVVDRLVRLAARRNSPYIPVRVSCETDELIRRVANPDRQERRKWTDADGVRAFVNSTEVLPLHGHSPMDIDVTTLSPEGAAQRILEHIRGLG